MPYYLSVMQSKTNINLTELKIKASARLCSSLGPLGDIPFPCLF